MLLIRYRVRHLSLKMTNFFAVRVVIKIAFSSLMILASMLAGYLYKINVLVNYQRFTYPAGPRLPDTISRTCLFVAGAEYAWHAANPTHHTDRYRPSAERCLYYASTTASFAPLRMKTS